MVSADELGPGKIVRINGAKSKLRAVAVRHAPSADDFRQRLDDLSYDCLLDGQTGQCMEMFSVDSCIVRTVEGHVAAVPLEFLEDYTPPAGEDGGFDVVWPVNDEDAYAFGDAVAQALLTRGYCVVQMFMGAEEQEEARDVANKTGELSEFKTELEVDFMGRNNYTKAKKLKPDDFEVEPSDALAQCERQLSQVGMTVGPLTPGLFGFETIGRSASFARTRFSNRSEAEKMAPQPLEQDDIEDGAVSNHIRCRCLWWWRLSNRWRHAGVIPCPVESSATFPKGV